MKRGVSIVPAPVPPVPAVWPAAGGSPLFGPDRAPADSPDLTGMSDPDPAGEGYGIDG